MTFAEEKTYEYIRYHYSSFVDRIHVLEILPYLSCLTTSDQVSWGHGILTDSVQGHGARSFPPKPGPTPSFSIFCILLLDLDASLTCRMKCGSSWPFPT